jgi:predicted ABC-type ATPase
MRVFAGPNGSGKSTIFEEVKHYEVEGKHIDLGVYVNADDIAKDLRNGIFDVGKYSLMNFDQEVLYNTASKSGLLSGEFGLKEFKEAIAVENLSISINIPERVEQVAQILADFLRIRLLEEGRKFTFETVFSHPSKLDLLLQAFSKGYKVYLYFVGTESPEINKFRVRSRVQDGGHDVSFEKIESRYYRSMEMLHDAAQASYQAFFFDNSQVGASNLFAHFKLVDGKKVWDPIDWDKVPQWFYQYYANKV